MQLTAPNIRQLIFELVNQVPAGRVTTFQALALALGDLQASRAVGKMIAELAAVENFPAHRVVYSDGRIALKTYSGGRLAAAGQLQKEGVPVTGWAINHLAKYLFEEFDSTQPLIRCRDQQQEIASRVCFEPPLRPFKTAAGVDLSYKSQWRAVGAYVLLDINTKQILFTDTFEQEISFPYITTYLAYRELPVLLPLLTKAKQNDRLADVILVDGSGILHPRHVGIASHLGVLLDVATIGVTKSKLYGEVPIRGMRPREVRSIIDPEDGRRIGAAIKTTENAEPIYISVGHKIDLETAVDLVLHLSTRKLPEPIHLAHKASREASQRSPIADQEHLDL